MSILQKKGWGICQQFEAESITPQRFAEAEKVLIFLKGLKVDKKGKTKVKNHHPN